MITELSNKVISEYEAKRLYLATASISIAELFDKAVQLIQYVTENHITREVAK